MSDLALTPGAMQHTKRRVLPDGGIIEFEHAPVGWLAKNGKPRTRDWRAYHFYAPPGAGDELATPGVLRVSGERRIRLPSVTTILDMILPKPGLPPWSEARGIEGAIMAVRDGLIDAATVTDPVRAVRSLRLGADAARDEAADRGLNLHGLLEDYMLHGEVPTPADHPEPHRGYIQALARWLAKTNPEPLAVEQLVCAPDDGYAGRLDLLARIGGFTTLVDLKTQERGQIYSGAHVQAGLYSRACVACGDDPPDRAIVVVLAANGEYREMACAADDRTCELALGWWQAVRPLESACESANRAERKARLEQAA